MRYVGKKYMNAGVHKVDGFMHPFFFLVLRSVGLYYESSANVHLIGVAVGKSAGPSAEIHHISVLLEK